ncbi:LOW QUALITY PROTEIN: aminoglycoside N3-acetyltransferase [Bacillus sp. JCM 19046]|nr:LOW QUALITY PROTEIN: aminoglycoside N3-acetyltransferase [Bacillus sp. JCM 19046]
MAKKGMLVLVHSSLKSLGWVCGGQLAVIQALQDVVTEAGTIIMPTHSADLTDPAEWCNPPFPDEWVPEIIAQMPAYDQERTPTMAMGAIPEAFRTYPDVERSNHPIHSFAVWGKDQANIAQNHSLNNGLGEESPIGYVYANDGYVLMLGTGYETNTSMHYAEHFVPGMKQIKQKSPIIENGARIWKEYSEPAYDETHFASIGALYEEEYDVTTGLVGQATARLVNQTELVDFTKRKLIEKAAITIK